MDSRPHVALVLTSALAAPRILGGQAGYLARSGFRVTVIAGPAAGVDLAAFGRREGVAIRQPPLEREPAPGADLRALCRLWRELRRLRPDVVEAGTPKAGALGMLAAALAGVPVRIYTLHGLRLETARGVRRAGLWLAERLATALAHETVAVGAGLLGRARELGLLGPGEGRVLAGGSANGVDIERFGAAAAARIDSRTADSRTIGYVGRLTRDKGLVELVAAFDRLRPEFPGLRLLLVGDFEDGDPLPEGTRRRIELSPEIELTGFVDDPADFYARLDVAALPSYREGLPNAALEAAAAGRSIVASRIPGMADAIVDGETGLLVPAGDVEALAGALRALLSDPARASRMGRAARERVAREFEPERVWRARAELYREWIARRPGTAIGRARPARLATDAGGRGPVRSGTPRPG